MKDANRTPVLNVAYGDRFRLNAHDVRTQAIVHPKVFGTTGGGSTSNFANISQYGQTLDAGVRVKNASATNGPTVLLRHSGVTFDGNSTDGTFKVGLGEEVFVSCSNLDQITFKTTASLNPLILTFIAT
tara:strand:- start:526 stop:912 length:387 start_codon:yes stop_codon:yes gene_type:complete